MSISAGEVQIKHLKTGTWEVLVNNEVLHVTWLQCRIGKEIIIEKPYSAQRFEAIVRQAISNPSGWQEMCAGVLEVEKIKVSDVLEEVRRRTEPDSIGLGTDSTSAQANCLIVPIPGHWGSIKQLDTKTSIHLIDDITKNIDHFEPPNPPDIAIYGSDQTYSRSESYPPFDAFDFYVSESAKLAPQCFHGMDPQNRPDLNLELLTDLDNWYKWPTVLLCFDSNRRGESYPIGIVYKPLDPESLFVPTLVARSGKSPDLRNTIEMNHTIFTGSCFSKQENFAKIEYTDKELDSLMPYLLSSCFTMVSREKTQNRDFVFSTKELRDNKLSLIRKLPPMIQPE